MRRGRPVGAPRRPLGEHGQVLPLPAFLGLRRPRRASSPSSCTITSALGQLADLAQLGRGEPDVLRAARGSARGRRAPRCRAARRAPGRARRSRPSRRGCGPAPAPRRARRCRRPRRPTPGWSSGGSSSAWSGCPQYQLTNAPEPSEPARSSPGHAELAVDRAAGGVDDRVEVLAQHVERHPALSDAHAAEELDARAGSKGCCSTLMTDFIFTWSGATPYRTRPYGAGSRSSTSTLTGTPRRAAPPPRRARTGPPRSPRPGLIPHADARLRRRPGTSRPNCGHPVSRPRCDALAQVSGGADALVEYRRARPGAAPSRSVDIAVSGERSSNDLRGLEHGDGRRGAVLGDVAGVGLGCGEHVGPASRRG